MQVCDASFSEVYHNHDNWLNKLIAFEINLLQIMLGVTRIVLGGSVGSSLYDPNF